MNNGVNNTKQTNANEQPILAPMQGVKIAPAQEGPINASQNNEPATTPAQNLTNMQGVKLAPVQEGPVNASQQAAAPPPPPVVSIAPVQAPPQPQPVATQPVQIPDPPKQKGINLTPLLVIVILGLIFYIVYSAKTNATMIQNLSYNCTPITASKEEKKLDVNSTLVKELYKKVQTSIREDYAEPEFNNSMKLYLAYRQILETEKYDSNCNLFSQTSMEPYTCEVSTLFVPKAFKEETLTQAIKELYGENVTIPFANIRLGTTCIGGYQYIPARGEFVEGYCNQNNAIPFKVTKTLKEASSTRNTIILKEEVKYHENEKLALPDYLKSGNYYYTFRLDLNYNYVLVNKTYESKY